MKERPIIFSGEQVRALLAGTKVQDRRVIKLRHGWQITERDDGSLWPWHPDYVTGGEWDGWAPCPYGRPGDLLWVRETHRPVYGQECGLIAVDYRATYDHGARLGDIIGTPSRWRAAIHMRREHSRITLEITDVRVQRLQDISYEDALAEGAIDGAKFCESSPPGRVHEISGETAEQTARRCEWPQRDFRNTLESIHGAGSWDANPWVWALTFRRVRP